MRIVTSKQMKQIEQNSIQYQMSYLRLMENAGCAAANFILQTLHDVSDLNCIVFCGKGNNGGDGFVVARKLAEQGAAVTIVLTEEELDEFVNHRFSINKIFRVSSGSVTKEN